MEIKLEVSEKNEYTESPYWLILDPHQNMDCSIEGLAWQITGPYFSREEAEEHLRRNYYHFSKKATVYCMSGCDSEQYKQAYRTAEKELRQKAEVK